LNAPHLARKVGSGNSDRHWEIVEALRAEPGYADYQVRCIAIGWKIRATRGCY